MSEITLKSLADDLQDAVAAMRTEAEADRAKLQDDVTAETKQALERAGERADAVEAKLEALSTAMNRTKQYADATHADGDEAAIARKQAWAQFIRKGVGGMTPEAVKSLSRGNDTQAGYLIAPSEYEADIIKKIIEHSPVRGLARVSTISGPSLIIPKRTGTFAASWVAEQGTRTETTGYQVGQLDIPAHELYAMVDLSRQLLEDAAFDMEAEMDDEAAEQFGVAEGAAFVSGSGVGKPEGFLTNADVLANSVTVSGNASTISADGLLNMQHDLKESYLPNATYLLNRSTLKAVRTMKDSQNQYLWSIGGFSGALSNDFAPTIGGRPYQTATDMPAQGSNNYSVVLADWQRFYRIVDRIGMESMRDDLTQATSGNVRFLVRKRVGGQVALAEAGRLLQCHT